MVRNRQSQDLYRAISRRMIRETEEFLLHAMGNPKQFVRIPAAEVKRAKFDVRMASVFWSQTLGVPYEIPPDIATLLAERSGLAGPSHR